MYDLFKIYKRGLIVAVLPLLGYLPVFRVKVWVIKMLG